MTAPLPLAGHLRRLAVSLLITSALMVPLAPQARAADPVLGTWASPPDGKGQRGHVVIRGCSGGYCGWLARAFGADGRQMASRFQGQMVVSQLAALGAGQYRALILVPGMGQRIPAQLVLSGDRMQVTGCAGPVCNRQVWTRVE